LERNQNINYEIKIPMVEIFETVEGEGTASGYPTIFVRLFNCNLRCTWCDTKYSYAPAKPEYFATITEIVNNVKRYGHNRVCLTGGEPLMDAKKSLMLIKALAEIENVEDIHVETNGAICLKKFEELRKSNVFVKNKLRFILDYKLLSSGENEKMIMGNFELLQDHDELKFVISSYEEFLQSTEVIQKWYKKGIILFSPVWESLSPQKLVSLILKHKLSNVKLNLQMHKVIWEPDTRGV
jgi:7-carboxy-7-deazaguanine synthase